MYQEHKICRPPRSPEAKIWKFLDFTKFLSLLETKSLYFARSDRLIDPSEGLYSKFSPQEKNYVYKDLPIPTPGACVKSFAETKKCVYLNCWHENEYESAAMWDLYSKSNEGVAIQSTFSRLSDSFAGYKKRDVYIGQIKYIDYSKEKPGSCDRLQPFLYKRKSFEHEREIRAIICDETSRGEYGERLFGMFVPVNIKVLIDNIYISPTAPGWIYDLVVLICKRYKIKNKIIKSNLFDDPVV